MPNKVSPKKSARKRGDLGTSEDASQSEAADTLSSERKRGDLGTASEDARQSEAADTSLAPSESPVNERLPSVLDNINELRELYDNLSTQQKKNFQCYVKDSSEKTKKPTQGVNVTSIVLETDSESGETSYELDDEQLAWCLSQPWSKWINNYSPGGILKLTSSDELNSYIQVALAYQSTLSKIDKYAFAESMLPPPQPDTLEPLHSFTASDSSYRTRLNISPPPTLEEYGRAMEGVISKENFGPEVQRVFQKMLGDMTNVSGYSVAQILKQTFPGMQSQTGEQFFQGQILSPSRGFALEQSGADRPRIDPRRPGSLLASASSNGGVVSLATAQLSKLTAQQKSRWDMRRVKLPGVVYDAMLYLSNLSVNLLTQGVSSITESTRREAVIWDACQKGLINLLKVHTQLLMKLYPLLPWPENFLSSWLVGDTCAAFTYADPFVPPTVASQAIVEVYNFHVYAGQNAYHTLLELYLHHGSTCTLHLLRNLYGCQYLGQGAKSYVLEMERLCVEGAENSRPPYGHEKHSGFSDSILLDLTVSNMFAYCQQEDSSMPHTDKVVVVQLFNDCNSGVYLTFSDFKDKVLSLVSSGYLLPQENYKAHSSKQLQASLGAAVEEGVHRQPPRKAPPTSLEPFLDTSEYRGAVRRVKSRLGSALFHKHFLPISLKGPEDASASTTYRYDKTTGSVPIEGLDSETRQLFFRLVFAVSTTHPHKKKAVIDAPVQRTSKQDPVRNKPNEAKGKDGKGSKKVGGERKDNKGKQSVFAALQQQSLEQKVQLDAIQAQLASSKAEATSTTSSREGAQERQQPSGGAAAAATEFVPPLPMQQWQHWLHSQQQFAQHQQQMANMMERQRQSSLFAAQHQADGGGYNSNAMIPFNGGSFAGGNQNGGIGGGSGGDSQNHWL